MDLMDIKARVDRSVSCYKAGVGTCSLALQLGFFFDCRERNIFNDEESNRLTNVGRLFRAYPMQLRAASNHNFSYAKVYIPGLGTPLNDSSVEQLESILDARQKALPADYGNALAEQGKETAVDTIKGIFKGDWSQVLSNKLGDLVTMKSGFDATVSAVKKATSRALAEAVAPIRDNRFMTALLMTGIDARVDYAKNKFMETIAYSSKMNELPIKLVQISIFGADLGAALARRFVDELLEVVCRKAGDEYWYNEIKVEVNFVGLFDCTRRSKVDQGDTAADISDALSLVTKNPVLSPVTFLFSAKIIDFDKPLHPAVKKALHLVAAHERRDYRPILPLGPLKAGWREELYPGISEDVTGGLLPNEQRPSAELCRVPLRDMYETAFSSQVPFPRFKTLNKKDPKVARYFTMLDNLKGFSVLDFCNYYRKWAGCLEVRTENFESHMAFYCLWLGEKLYDLRGMRRNLGLTEWHKRSELNDRWGWLDEVGRDADAISRGRGFSNKLVQAANRVTYFQPSMRVPIGIDMFFNYFMHDVNSKEHEFAITDSQANTMFTSNNFFMSRKIDSLSSE